MLHKTIDDEPISDFTTAREIVRRDYKNIALVLQGGGALGSYQSGVVELLDEVGIHVNWVSGISIGAINAAIVAGNPPGRRAEMMKSFWEGITSRVQWPWMPADDLSRVALNNLASMSALFFGQPGFFNPRVPSPHLARPGGAEATSYYDTLPLKATLEAHVDFDYLNHGPTRFSVGAVNVRSGNFVYFDNRERTIRPEHVMASGALPPGFPAIDIDGELYWDGGLVSNTPLSYVLNNIDGDATLIFQVDLFSALGSAPHSLPEVQERQKDIQYSSRTRLNTDLYKRIHRLKRAVSVLLERLPPEQRVFDDPSLLESCKDAPPVNIMHLIYRRKSYDRAFKDYEFSRNTMVDHWQAGRNTLARTLRHANWFKAPSAEVGVATHDIDRDADD